MKEPFELLEPKYENWIKADWKVSKRTKKIITLYAKYSGREESQVVDFLLAQMIIDKKFAKWLISKRDKKSIIAVIFGGVEPNFEEAEKEVSDDDATKKDFPFG